MTEHQNFSSGVTIGFEQTAYTVEEGLVVEVCVLVTSGTLQRDATVVLSSIDDEAVGKRRASITPMIKIRP